MVEAGRRPTITMQAATWEGPGLLQLAGHYASDCETRKIQSTKRCFQETLADRVYSACDCKQGHAVPQHFDKSFPIQFRDTKLDQQLKLNVRCCDMTTGSSELQTAIWRCYLWQHQVDCFKIQSSALLKHLAQRVIGVLPAQCTHTAFGASHLWHQLARCFTASPQNRRLPCKVTTSV